MGSRLPKSVRWFIIFIFVLGSGQWSSTARSAEQSPVEPAPLALCTESTARIMPLGDSITAGSSSGTVPEDDTTLWISYRIDLWDGLNAAGYSVDFVGSQVGGDAYTGFDPHHEGHPGWTDTQIAMNIYNNGENWLGDLGTNWPHIILLHIGTNLLDTSPADVENILNEIDEYETATGRQITVILARIIDMVPNSATLHTFNNNVQAMAEARTGDDIVMVDMEDGAGIIYSVQPAGDMANNLHPWETGYTKMAAVWEAALEQVFLTCNNPPFITSNPGNQNSAENDPVSLDFEATEQDAGQTLSWSAESLPPGLAIDSQSGTISGTIDYTAAAGSPYSSSVTVHDSGHPSASDSYGFTWTVTNMNQPPSASDDEYAATEEQPLSVAAPGILGNDSDPDGQSITAALVSGPEDGNLSLSANGSFTYTPDPNFSGLDSFTYQASDGTAPSDAAMVTINVENINDPPVAQNRSLTTDEDLPLQVTLLVDDPDEEDTLSYTILNQPDHGTLSGEAPDLTYAPAANYFGADSFTFKASDGTAESNQATVNITVSAVNDLDVTNPGAQFSQEGDSVRLRIQAGDAEGDILNFAMSGAPPELAIDADTGLIFGTVSLDALEGSPYQVTVTVSDGIDSVPVEFSWTIGESPRVFLPMVTRK